MQHGLLAAELLNAFMYTNICHCSPVTNLVKWWPPEEPSTDFELGSLGESLDMGLLAVRMPKSKSFFKS